MDLDDYLEALRRGFARMDDEEREAVLVEIRDYLDQESERLRNLSPGLAKKRALAKAIEDFGAPEDIAVGYDSKREELAVVNQRTGEWLLDIPTIGGSTGPRRFSTTARGLRVMIKYRGPTVIGVIGLAALFIAAAIFFAGQAPIFQGDVQDVLYEYHGEGHFEEMLDGPIIETFDADADAASFTLRLDVASEDGCVRIQVEDPSGATVHDTQDVCGGDGASATLDLEGSGTWWVRYDYTSYVGTVDVTATAQS